MSFGVTNSSISLEEILKVISEAELLAYYLGITEIPTKISSPLRRDRNPSFYIFTNDGVKIRWKDFGTRDSGGTIDLLSRLWNIPFGQVLLKIQRDIPSISQSQIIPVTGEGKRGIISKVYSKETDIEVKVRSWKEHDLEFWSQYFISKEWLKFGEVYPISHIILIKKGQRNIIPADKYAYVYVEYKDGIPTLKIYQPYNLRFKWMSKHDASVWDLWNQLPKTGKQLIITSSRKDALSIWENLNIPATGLQGEGYIPKEHVVNELKERFSDILLLYDNDFDAEINYGRQYGREIAETFGLKQIEIPTEYQSKDSSDLFKNLGKQQATEVLLSLINTKD